MSILEAVILLARVVKQVADDSSSNATTVQSLAARVESMVRVLQKIPDNTELDPGLLNRMHEHLKEAHRLIVKYDKKGSVLRLISASSMKSKLGAVEAHIGRCIDDLSFNVGITSAAVLEGIRADLREAAEKEGKSGEDTATTEPAAEAQEEEEEEAMDLSGFDELTTHIENLSSAVKVFGSFDCFATSATTSVSADNTVTTEVKVPAASVVLFGDKLVLHNFQKPEAVVAKTAPTRYVEYEETTGAENVAVPVRAAGDVRAHGATAGTIVFHIDNTSSMLREKRMELTKGVLRRVIPNFLRMGFHIIVNAWASTTENKGRIVTRVVAPDAALLQALLGVEPATSQAGSAQSAETAAEDSAVVDHEAQLLQYLDTKVFDILTPKGQTDLYGSCFQLLRQCRSLLQPTPGSAAAPGPVYAFVLTDGEHNRLDFPLHAPSKEGEDYFGVYAAAPITTGKGKLAFVRTGEAPSVPLCERSLRRELDNLNGVGDGVDSTESSAAQKKLALTFIGIGDAETKPLSALTEALGSEQCSCYGITEVAQSDAVFQNISVAGGDMSVAYADSTGKDGESALPLKFTFEDESVGKTVTQGTAAVVSDHGAVQLLHQASCLTLRLPAPAAGSALSHNSVNLAAVTDTHHLDKTAAAGSKNTAEFEARRITTTELYAKIGEFVSEIRKIRPTAYVVDADTFSTVFRQLLVDKKSLQNIKASFLSKHTRRLRQYSAFSALGVWLSELENLIETQISSYRMNVESEILSRIAQAPPEKASGAGAGAGAASSAAYLQPTQLVLVRLQNNLSNAGRSTHKVMRHVAAISSIRERTMHIAGTLFSTGLSLEYLRGEAPEGATAAGALPVGLRLVVQRSGGVAGAEEKSFTVDWRATATNLQAILDTCMEVKDAGIAGGSGDGFGTGVGAFIRYNNLLSDLNARTNRGNKSYSDIDAVLFPCVLLRARFDQFAIVRATYVFSLTDIHCVEEGGALKAAVYCAQEVWELCHASNHIVGEPLTLACLDTADAASLKSAPNMILPLAYTPFLFALYVERARAYHSAVNVTADCMALTVVSLQWAKVYHDVLLFTVGADSHRFHPAATVAEGDALQSGTAAVPGAGQQKLRVLVDQALKAAVALSYSVDSSVMLPSKVGLSSMFGYTAGVPGTSEAVVSNDGIISREDCAGVTCSVAVAALFAGAHLPYAELSGSWNLLLRTIYSRLAESIAGTKNIRSASPSAADGTSAPRADPGIFENDYRLKLGDLQGLLRKRLNTEWPKCTFDEKRTQVQASAAEVLVCLQEIATLYLTRLGECGLQSWAQASGIVHQTLLLKNYGLAQLRAELIECKPTTALVDQLVAAGSTWASSPLVLPLCELRDGALALREMTAQDVDHIVLLIDAVVATKAAPKVAYKPILNPSFPAFSTAANRAVGFKHNPIEWDETLPSVNVAFIGNVNSGKSSISGMLLSYLNIVPAEVVSRLGQEAAKLGLPEALKHAWVMDTTSHERRGGFTIKPTWAGFQTPTRRYTIIDNPGHKDFCRNAAFGVFEADAVVLVMPADVFGQDPAAAVAESSAETKLLSAQAEEHLMTAFCFGVREIVVAVNKMDLVAYSQAAFENVRAVTQKMLKKAGFKPESAIFVPVSVADSDGFLQASDRASAWYTGPGLLQACDDLPQPKRIVDRPLRMVVDEVYQCKIKPNGQGSAILCGKIERGALSLQDTVSCYPFGPQRASVQSIQLHGTTTHEAKAGDNVGVLISIDAHAVRVAQGNRKVSPADVKAEQTPRKGCVVTLTSQPAVTVMHRFEAQLLVIRGTAFRVGYKPSLTTHIVTVSVHITKLVEIIGRNNVVLESNPTEVKAGQTVVCEMTALRPFAAETMHDMPRLSRFLIKEDRAITAMGVIRRVIS